MSQNNTHGGRSGHQGTNSCRKNGDEKQRKQNDNDHARAAAPAGGRGHREGHLGSRRRLSAAPFTR